MSISQSAVKVFFFLNLDSHTYPHPHLGPGYCIDFQGPKTWNSIDESLKSGSISAFKKKLKNLFISQYWTTYSSS